MFGFDASHPEIFFPKMCLQPDKDVFTTSFNVLQDAFWTSVRRLLERNLLGLWKETFSWAYGKKPSIEPALVTIVGPYKNSATLQQLANGYHVIGPTKSQQINSTRVCMFRGWKPPLKVIIFSAVRLRLLWPETKAIRGQHHLFSWNWRGGFTPKPCKQVKIKWHLFLIFQSSKTYPKTKAIGDEHLKIL